MVSERRKQMILSLFHIKPNFFKNRVFHGIIYFLMLVALAMTLMNPIIVLLPAVLAIVIPFAFGISEYETGYIAVALSVCKNE